MTHYCYGVHAVKALLEKHPERVKVLFVVKSKDKTVQDILTVAKQHGLSVQFSEKTTLDQKAQHHNHQGVLADCLPAKTYAEADLDELLDCDPQSIFLILDGIQDPHNLGACLRSADAAGVRAVIIPRDRAVGLTDAVYKVASGAAETVPVVQVTNLARTLKEMQAAGVWLYGCDDQATEGLYQTDLKGKIGLVLGREDEGLHSLTKKTCDHLINIPMQGCVSSLNVSVATGIVLFEAVRQRL